MSENSANEVAGVVNLGRASVVVEGAKGNGVDIPYLRARRTLNAEVRRAPASVSDKLAFVHVDAVALLFEGRGSLLGATELGHHGRVKPVGIGMRSVR